MDIILGLAIILYFLVVLPLLLYMVQSWTPSVLTDSELCGTTMDYQSAAPLQL